MRLASTVQIFNYKSWQERENYINIIYASTFFLTICERTFLSQRTFPPPQTYSKPIATAGNCLAIEVFRVNPGSLCTKRFLSLYPCAENKMVKDRVTIKNKGAVLLDRAVLGPSWGDEHPKLDQGPPPLSCARPEDTGGVWLAPAHD